MTKALDRWASVRGLAAVLVLCACVAGCGREAAPPEPPATAPAVQPTSDGEAAYVAALTNSVRKQQDNLKSLANAQKLLRKLEVYQPHGHQRELFGRGATPEQVRAELEENPRKYPAYAELVAAQEAAKKAVTDNFSKAREMIRARHGQSRTAGGGAQGAAAAEK